MADEKPKIVIKKIIAGGHGGHHGGAWKVAYADFVTAMMAFFLLLWLISTAPEATLQGLADFFTPTVGLEDQMGIGIQGGISNVDEGSKRSVHGSDSIVFGAPSSGEPVQLKRIVVDKDRDNFIKFKNDLSDSINKDAKLKQFSNQIQVDTTPEGLLIRLMDSKDRPMFVIGSSDLEPYTKDLLSKITGIVKFLPNYLSVIGHTSALSNNGTTTIDAWRLSSDRANAARAYMVSVGIDQEQIAQIIGKGDHDPMNTKDPGAPENIRLEILVLKNSVMSYTRKFGDEAVSLEDPAVGLQPPAGGGEAPAPAAAPAPATPAPASAAPPAEGAANTP